MRKPASDERDLEAHPEAGSRDPGRRRCPGTQEGGGSSPSRPAGLRRQVARLTIARFRQPKSGDREMGPAFTSSKGGTFASEFPRRRNRTPAVLPPRAHFRPAQLALWIPLCLVHGGATAWLAFGIQKRFAPLGLFPILLGLAMGITLAGLMRLVHVAGRSTIVAGTVVAVTVAVFGQHYFCYQEQASGGRTPGGAVFAWPLEPIRTSFAARRPYRPTAPSNSCAGRQFAGVPSRGRSWREAGGAWASWALDGGLVLLAALLVVIPAARQPYCDRCRTWYSTVRRGAVSLDAAAAVATELGFTAPEEALSASVSSGSVPGRMWRGWDSRYAGRCRRWRRM